MRVCIILTWAPFAVLNSEYASMLALEFNKNPVVNDEAAFDIFPPCVWNSSFATALRPYDTCLVVHRILTNRCCLRVRPSSPLWDMSITERQRSSTRSALHQSQRMKQAVSHNTLARSQYLFRLRRMLLHGPSLSWTPPDMQRSRPCVPAVLA